MKAFALFLAAAVSVLAAPPEWRAPNLLDFLRFSVPMPTVAAAPPVTEEEHSRPLSLTRILGLRINRIVIDAGHGGADLGAVSADGLREKDVALDVTLRIAALVREAMHVEVILTRSEDVFVPLGRRSAIANDAQADLFLSVHANSSRSKAAAGAEAFIMSLSGSVGAMELARRENAGSEHSVGQLQDLVRAIALNDKVSESETLAEMLQTPLSIHAAKFNGAAKNRGIRRAPFLVLLGASMPAVLAEIGFLSNPEEARNLRSPAYRQQVAAAIFAGLVQYADSLSASCSSYCP